MLFRSALAGQISKQFPQCRQCSQNFYPSCIIIRLYNILCIFRRTPAANIYQYTRMAAACRDFFKIFLKAKAPRRQADACSRGTFQHRGPVFPGRTALFCPPLPPSCRQAAVCRAAPQSMCVFFCFHYSRQSRALQCGKRKKQDRKSVV